MTEDEAKKCWCPFKRIGVTERAAAPAFNWLLDVNTGEDSAPRGGHCVGSACMAWRTRPVRTHVQDVRRGQTADASPPPIDIVTHDGFCGLAGAPQ